MGILRNFNFDLSRLNDLFVCVLLRNRSPAVANVQRGRQQKKKRENNRYIIHRDQFVIN